MHKVERAIILAAGIGKRMNPVTLKTPKPLVKVNGVRMIDTIIKANNNLTDSNSRNDWEMMGSDIKTLQELIERLDKMRQENNKKTTTTNTQSTQSTEAK